jgi:serine/threonine protein kinase
MAQAESSIVSVTHGGEDGGVPAKEAYSSKVADDKLYVTAPTSMASCSHESLEAKTARMIEKTREQGWSELTDRGHNAVGSCGHDQATRAIWEELKRWYPRRFRDDVEVELGRLIGEGGQAQIYEAKVKGDIYELETQYDRMKCVAKVYKMEGFSLADLQRQWPLRTKDPLGRGTVLGEVVFNDYLGNCSAIYLGTFLEDGRFAFVMARRWGDLRTFIDLKLSDNNSLLKPPFSYRQAVKIMRDIAWGVRELHSRGVLHRDLKAANILVRVSSNPNDGLKCYVADFESSMLVQGTGFWRAPEVLIELQKEPSNRNVEIWTEKVDAYSYAMTCYEILTGHIPFFGYAKNDWKRIIDGERPHLPDYIDLKLKELVERCWHKDPSNRPLFEAIERELGNFMRK